MQATVPSHETPICEFDSDLSRTATLLAEYVRDIPIECPAESRVKPAPPPMPHRQPKPIRRWPISLTGLLILLTGLFCSGLILYRGQNTWHPAVRPIESIRVGQAVRSENPTGEEDLSLGDHVDPPTWRHLVLKAPKLDGSWADVELLRPLWWLKERDAKVGAFIDIDVPHCGIEGEAEVLAITPCPPVEPTPKGYRTVTGTFRHHNAEVIDLYVEGLDEPIGTTLNHPFWSATSEEFVAAGTLCVGDLLVDIDSRTHAVTSVQPRDGLETVYNIEVATTHAYGVATNGIVVHNTFVDCHGVRHRNNGQFAAKPGPKAQNTEVERLRRKAVADAWKQERALAKAGKPGTREWKDEELAELIQTGRVTGYSGHHINSVMPNRKAVGNPDNIEFLTDKEHLKAHKGNWRTPTDGDLLDRSSQFSDLTE